MPVSTEDYIAISDHLGRYCWAVDSNDVDGWVALWTEDAVFSGVTPEPLVGHAGLRTVPKLEQDIAGGWMRHMVGNLHCDYVGDDQNTVRARYYNLVTTWNDGGRNFCCAVCEAVIVRNGQGWLIRRSDAVMAPGSSAELLPA